MNIYEFKVFITVQAENVVEAEQVVDNAMMGELSYGIDGVNQVDENGDVV